MSTGAKVDLVKYLIARTVAFVGLTAISTFVMALPYRFFELEQGGPK
jgi:hypothetical protein